VLAGPTFDVSTRSIDNFYVPHEGYVLQWTNEFASRDLGSDFDITTTEFGGDLYVPTFELDDGTRAVLHAEFNFGAQQPYNETLSTPYTERYFLGGTSSLRGFRYRGVGPMDKLSDEPLGGETRLFGTFEWYFPLTSYVQPGSYRSIEAVRLGLFFDYGALGVESWNLDPDDLRTSAGFTIGLTYPLPFTFNFGYPIRELPGDERQTFSFSIQTR
jgi:outer membrane protein insertion porin family